MAKLVFGMNQSLDGYVDHDNPGFTPSVGLFRHFTEHVGSLTGSVYGRRLYEVMRYWDDEHSDWTAPERDFAAVWRRQQKWVVSRTLKSVGPNATLIADNAEAAIRDLKTRHEGEIDIGGPALAHATAGLIDEYHLYLRPVVLGQGKPFFAGPRPPLRLIASDAIGDDALRLKYVPA